VHKDQDWANWNNTLQNDLNIADLAAIKLRLQLSEVIDERDRYRNQVVGFKKSKIRKISDLFRRHKSMAK